MDDWLLFNITWAELFAYPSQEQSYKQVDGTKKKEGGVIIIGIIFGLQPNCSREQFEGTKGVIHRILRLRTTNSTTKNRGKNRWPGMVDSSCFHSETHFNVEGYSTCLLFTMCYTYNRATLSHLYTKYDVRRQIVSDYYFNCCHVTGYSTSWGSWAPNRSLIVVASHVIVFSSMIMIDRTRLYHSACASMCSSLDHV